MSIIDNKIVGMTLLVLLAPVIGGMVLILLCFRGIWFMWDWILAKVKELISKVVKR